MSTRIMLNEEELIINRTYSNVLVIIANVLALFNFIAEIARLFFNLIYTQVLESQVMASYMSVPNNSGVMPMVKLSHLVLFENRLLDKESKE